MVLVFAGKPVFLQSLDDGKLQLPVDEDVEIFETGRLVLQKPPKLLEIPLDFLSDLLDVFQLVDVLLRDEVVSKQIEQIHFQGQFSLLVEGADEHIDERALFHRGINVAEAVREALVVL